MEMVDSVITSSSLKSPGNTASMNCRKMKVQPRKSTHKVIPASEVSDLATPCTLANCNQASTVHCSNEDSQLNIGKDAKFVYCEHSTMCIKDTSCLALEDIIPTGWESDTDCPASEDIIASGWESDTDTGFPASEDIIATGWESSSHSDMPEPGCTEMSSLSSDLAGAREIQSVPCDSRFVGSDLCPSNSDMVYTGILRSNSGCTRFNSQVKSSSSGWSRNRMVSNGFRKFQTHSREFGKARSARRDQSYTGSLSSVNSSLSQIKCVKKEARHNDISASNQTYRAKPMGSDFVRQRVRTRNKKQGTHAPRESYVENHSVAETRSTGSSPSNQFALDQQLLSSELPYAVGNVPHQNAHRSTYRMREGIYRNCGQEADVPPMCSFDQGFGVSGVQCLSVPVQSSATGYLALEGWTDGTFQPYSFDASQHLSTPGLYTGTTIDFSVPQQGGSQCYYGHESVSSGLYQCGFMSEFNSQNLHGIPQPAQLISYVPFDYHGAMFHPEQVMSDADLVSPEETKHGDSNNRIGAKVNEKTKTFDGCDATSRTPETETREKIDSIGSNVTDSVRTYKADKHSDGNKNQVDLLLQCSAPGDQFTYVCSQKTAEALAASWKSQVDSESILEATGSPIAQFEKLLNATAPIIASSSYNPPDVSLCSTPRSTLLSKSWWPDVSLLDVWEWYIECASFGIGVKVEDSWNSDYFSAYFIPSLSAVQLLGYSQSSLSNSLKKLNVDVHETENTGNCLGSPSSGSDIPSSLLPNDSSEDVVAGSSAPSFCFSDDAELIFEYFEHDQPQNRKPLPQTIVEIKEQGSSNPHSLGDPSKLDQLKLHDLHPASWYSVAWYPIYRIPENNRTNIPPLRASFLTYHSLSHLVMRHESPDQLGNSSLCVVPALGMLRYNGKEECWYCPTEFPGPVRIHGLPSDNSKVVEQRLRALEEVAATFSDGHIQKNGVRAGNKHPDYDFFIRRT